MKLDFRLFLFDDQPANIESSIKLLAVKMLDQGFRLTESTFPNFAEAKALISSSGILYDDIDLFAVDYDLGTGLKGDQVIQEIRKEIPFRDIIFYSSNSTEALNKMIGDERIQGVYCCQRDELDSTILELFKDIMRRVLDLSAARGIVLGATCELEQILTACFTNLENISDKEVLSDLRAMVLKRLTESRDEYDRIASMFGKSSFVGLEKEFRFSAADRADVLLKYMKHIDHSSLGSLKIVRHNIIPKRNDLSHKKLKVVGSTTDTKGAAKGYTEAELTTLRKDIIGIWSDFENLQEALGLSETT